MTDSKKEKPLKRVGEFNHNKHGSKMEIIEYTDYNNIVIKFEDGYISNDSYGNFKKGLIKNPCDRTIYNVGYLGIENYNNNKNVSYRPSYNIWRDMLYRCYSEKKHIQNPSYIDCYVCDDWLCYNNFEKWFCDNYYELDNEKVHLDKDILVQGNKIYSPDTCIFVPQTINQIFQSHEKRKCDIPTGVGRWGKKFVALVRDNLTKSVVTSTPFISMDEARVEYVKLKTQYILRIGEYYKNNIPLILYESLVKNAKEYAND